MWLIKAFVILGPLGNLLTPQFVTHSFRTYYLTLCLFPIFYTRTTFRQLKVVIFSMFIVLYCFFSLGWRIGIEEDMPFFRLCLLLIQFLFVWGASFFMQSEEKIFRLIMLYCKAFFTSLVLGYLFYIGYYMNVIPLSVLEFFSVITQLGYGFLRFAPGSYPNEYGICCSFVMSLITFLFFDKKICELNISRKWLILWYVLLGIALLLTTTRAAYLSYAFALMYLMWRTGGIRLLLVSSSLLFGVIILVLRVCGINMFRIFSVGFDIVNLNSGSLADRFQEWKNGSEFFMEQPFIGTGFASQSGLHNLYLEIFFELGIMGILILAGTWILYFLNRGYLKLEQNKSHNLLHTILILGVIHVLWFAASNHNLNHHLTWFVIFLWLCLRQSRSTQISLARKS